MFAEHRQPRRFLRRGERGCCDSLSWRVVVHAPLFRIDGGFGQDLFLNLNVGHDGSAFDVGYSGGAYPLFAVWHTENGDLVTILIGTPVLGSPATLAYVGSLASTVPESRWSLSSASILRIWWNMRHAVLYVTPNSRSNCLAEIPQCVEAILKIA